LLAADAFTLLFVLIATISAVTAVMIPATAAPIAAISAAFT
jgi:hypothetical protein